MTFRAAAIDQIEVWASRVGVDIISHRERLRSGGCRLRRDPEAARAVKADVLICDTAGRLAHKEKPDGRTAEGFTHHRQGNAGEPGAKTSLSLDATTGQNAVSQAKTFSEVTDITGIVLTEA